MIRHIVHACLDEVPWDEPIEVKAEYKTRLDAETLGIMLVITYHTLNCEPVKASEEDPF